MRTPEISLFSKVHNLSFHGIVSAAVAALKENERLWQSFGRSDKVADALTGRSQEVESLRSGQMYPTYACTAQYYASEESNTEMGRSGTTQVAVQAGRLGILAVTMMPKLLTSRGWQKPMTVSALTL